MKTTEIKTRRHIRFCAGRVRRGVAAVFLVFFLVISSQNVYAQNCENPALPYAAEAADMAAQKAEVLLAVQAIEAAWDSAGISLLRQVWGNCSTGTCGAQNTVIGALNNFWSEWFKSWQGMTAQLSASTLNESRELSSIDDANNVLAAARDVETERVKATKRYQPTVQACRFDTTAQVMGDSMQMSSALQSGYEWDFVQLGNNEKGSSAQDGPAQEQSNRWYNYHNIFCDYRAENGNAGCAWPHGSPQGTPSYSGTGPLPQNFQPTLLDPGKPGYAIIGTGASAQRNDQNLLPFANMDAEPSLLIFSQYTIDMFNTVELTAVNQMIFNVTGYQIPKPMLITAMDSVDGMENTLKRRRYITQMDTVGALLYSLIADRAPGKSSPEIYLLRTKGFGAKSNQATDSAIQQSMSGFLGGLWSWATSGFNTAQQNQLLSQMSTPPAYMMEASVTPSQREIRQSIIEQLWDPNYYKRLYNNPSTIMRKDVYLKAYSLVLLYDLISRQEKISDVYAVETANLLQSTRSLTRPASVAPVQ